MTYPPPPQTPREAILLAIQEVDDLFAINLHSWDETEMVARVLAYLEPFLAQEWREKNDLR
jgi:hypothetical protein